MVLIVHFGISWTISCLQNRSCSMLVMFHLPPNMFPKLSTPTGTAQSSSLGFPHISPLLPLTTSLQFPCPPPQIPSILPLLSPSFRAEPPSQDPPLQHILCCCLEQGEGKSNIKAIPLPHLFSTLGGSSLSTRSFFCSFPPFFPWRCQKAPWHGWEGKEDHEK